MRVFLLLTALLGTALLKIVTGRPSGSDYSANFLLAVAVAELTLCALVAVPRSRRIGLYATLLFAVCGIGHAMIARPHLCGCLGAAFRIGWRGELVLASTLGFLAALTLGGSKQIAAPAQAPCARD